MFVPLEEAFNYIRNLPGADYNTNATLLDKVFTIFVPLSAPAPMSAPPF